MSAIRPHAGATDFIRRTLKSNNQIHYVVVDLLSWSNRDIFVVGQSLSRLSVEHSIEISAQRSLEYFWCYSFEVSWCLTGEFMGDSWTMKIKRRDVDSFTIFMKNTATYYDEWWNQQFSGLDRYCSPWQLLHMIHIMFRFKVFWTQIIISEAGILIYDEVQHPCRPKMLPSLTSCFPRDLTIWPMPKGMLQKEFCINWDRNFCKLKRSS
jgi:hypothetical protein